ncbi:MAG: glucose-1-phosphate cytidylyltransferase [Deltaproteobacteria bacterium]|nr:glucose-1-phosphate cytidylyltransferase [Deltaproteobacteria bacterium]
MKAVILCGGRGTRLHDATAGTIPKPMVEVGGRPLLWHIMKGYAHHGHNDFVLCLGHLGHVIKEYFLHYEAMNSDLTLHMGSPGRVDYHGGAGQVDWTVTLADTGKEAGTGTRLARVEKHLGREPFLLTYGDGVADVDIGKLLAFHRSHGRIATVTGVIPTGRFGLLWVENGRVVRFLEKPSMEVERINGGFFVFNPEIFDVLRLYPECMLEQEPLEKLSQDGELMMYEHDGYWRCVDTLRDLLELEEHWSAGRSPWVVWKDGD